MIKGVVGAGVLVTTMAFGLAGCGHSTAGLGRLTVNGQVQLTPAHAAERAGHTGDTLQAGDRVAVRTGEAGVRLLGGVLTLRTGAELTIGTTSDLTTGSVLIQPAGQALRVSAQASTLVVPTGVAQLAVGSVATGLVAKVYRGASNLDTPGNPPAPIAAPRQITLTPQTRLPVQAVPLHYLDSDPWDHSYLSEAVVVSTQLGAAATGFDAEVPATQGKDPAFYQALVPDLSTQLDFATVLAAVERAQPARVGLPGKPGDYLIATVIALRGSHGTLESRLNNELVFSAEGAPWGFVAYDQGVTDLNGVLNEVLAAIGRAALPGGGAPTSQVAIGPPVTTVTPTTHPGRPTPGATTTTTTPANPRQGHPSNTTTTTGPVPLIQLPVPVLPGPLGALLNPLLDPLIQSLNSLLGGKH